MLRSLGRLSENPMTTAALGFFNAPTLRRVRKAEASPSTVRTADPYAMLMACWVDYMSVRNLDLGGRGMKLIGDAVPDATVGEAQYMADLKLGECVNAMVSSLPMVGQWAICKSQGVAKVWRYPNACYESVLMDARDELEKKLRNNVATRLYWA
jgi:hypothetical protein